MQQMFNQQIDNLIEFALADGELTEKERQVLLRKAEAMGIDLDEFEMVLDAKLHQARNSSPVPPPVPTRLQQTTAAGDVLQCPRCKSVVPSFQAMCDCGYELRGAQAAGSINRLFELLNDAEAARSGQKKDSVGMLIAKEIFKQGGSDDVTRRQMEIVSTFPIPNTKEDIVEFLALALPKTQKKGNIFTSSDPENKAHNEFVNIWKDKCSQVIMKAKFAFKSDPSTLKEILGYAKEMGIKV